MTVAIVGGRNFHNRELLFEKMHQAHKKHRFTGVVSGGATGADMLGAHWAEAVGLPLTEHFPDWEKDGKAAAFIRNALIVDDADIIIAFWDGESRGTIDTIKKAKAKGKLVYVVDFDGNAVEY